MTKYSSFNKNTLKALRAEMDALLSKYGIDSNLEIEVGNMRFSDSEVDIKVKAKIKGATTHADTVLLSIMNAYKLKQTASNGDTLVQYNSRSYKYPFVFRKAEDGKLYKLDSYMAKIRFAA